MLQSAPQRVSQNCPGEMCHLGSVYATAFHLFVYCGWCLENSMALRGRSDLFGRRSSLLKGG
jgi:hypothetical protein